MSKDTIRAVAVVGRAININNGFVSFHDARQVSRRRHCLVLVEGPGEAVVDEENPDNNKPETFDPENVYEVVSSFQMKQGELFGYDGVIPKGLARDVLEMDDNQAEKFLEGTDKQKEGLVKRLLNKITSD